MRYWITNSFLCHMDEVIEHDDIIYYPHELYLPKDLNDEMRHCYRSGILRDIPISGNLLTWQQEAEEAGTAHVRAFGTNTRAMSILSELRALYRDVMFSTKAEPHWIHRLSKKLRGDIRRHWRVVDYEDPEVIVPQMPYTDVRYLVREGGVCTQTIRACKLYRLGRIRQLGNLHDPSVFEAGFASMGQRFGHTRLSHVHDVSALITLMAMNNGVETRLAKHLRVAALIHDALTPAHGDGTKAIDPLRFDEDAFIATLLEGEEWEALKKQHGLSRSLLVDLVQHRHVLGALLDYADRLAYTSRDLDAYLQRYWNYSRISATREYQELSRIVSEDPHFLSLWDVLHVSDRGGVYCSDPEKLERFLRVRILMFKALYYNPHARFMEYFISRMLVGVLYRKGIVTHDALLQMGDFELDGIISDVVQEPYVMGFPNYFGEAHLKRFAHRSEAKDFQSELIRQGFAITLLDDVDRKIKTGAGYLVRNRAGELQPFRDAYPHQTSALEHLAVISSPYAVYWLDNNEITTRVKELLDTPTH